MTLFSSWSSYKTAENTKKLKRGALAVLLFVFYTVMKVSVYWFIRILVGRVVGYIWYPCNNLARGVVQPEARRDSIPRPPCYEESQAVNE